MTRFFLNRLAAHTSSCLDPDRFGFYPPRDRADRIGPSTTDLLTCLHRGAWWVKLDVLGKLRSGAERLPLHERSGHSIAIGERMGCRFSSGPVKAARSVSWAADWLAVREPQIGDSLR